MKSDRKGLSSAEREGLLKVLKSRFEANMHRHEGIQWAAVQEKLNGAEDGKLWSLGEMERTGGEPDVVGAYNATAKFLFFDCSPESPKGRRSVCYDPEALESRKEHKPAHSAIGMAAEMGVTILSEDQYRDLQKLGRYDTKTSSWVETPASVRSLGGAIFGDWRYGRVFIYHNGAESYYGARGFRASLRI